MEETKQQTECAPAEARDEIQTVPLWPIRNRQQMWEFLRKYLDMKIPDRRVCGHHAAPMDYLWHAYACDRKIKYQRANIKNAEAAAPRHILSDSSAAPQNDNMGGRDGRAPSSGDCIVWANRAGGKTQLAAIATLLEGLFKPKCQTLILAGSLEQSGRMYDTLCEFVQRVPEFKEQLDGKMLKDSCRFQNGTTVEALAQ